MQKEMITMYKHMRKQDLEVNNLVFLINVIYVLMFDWIYYNTHTCLYSKFTDRM